MLSALVRPAVPGGLLAAMLLLAACGGGADNAGGPVTPADALHVSCLTKPDPGPCRGAKPAFYYDYQSDSCKQFTWGGCQGSVPFGSLDECRRMCTGGR
jgi:hypothetical protein